EREQHDRPEQLRSVELFAWPRAVVYVADLREEHPQHPEQQERAHERPEIAQHRAVEAQLEFRARERERQCPEAPEIPAKRGRRVYAVSRGRAPRDGERDALARAHPRSIVMS